MGISILVIDDDPMQQEITQLLLSRRFGYLAVPALNGRQGLLALQKNEQIQLVILDMGLPDIEGLELLQLIRERRPDVPVIVVTGQRDLAMAVQAMKSGAHDFITKPAQRERLEVAIINALKTGVLEKEVTRLKSKEEGSFSFNHLIGCDGGLKDVIAIGRKASSSDIPVMLTGETGTGKEVFARAIHGESRRTGAPFVAINCGAIPAQLVESILFGHEKGAFTGAIAKSIGRFREAEGGTIFLDEIGDLPLEAQVKLLRVLQQKEVRPVGGASKVPINVRVISATHQNLEEKVRQGLFREDLFFRLNILPIHQPSLRERKGDIAALVRHFIERVSASESRPLYDISEDAIRMLESRNWPGNVRELENTIHRAIIMAESQTLHVGDFSAIRTAGTPIKFDTTVHDSPRSLAEIEREAIVHALQYFQGNMTLAAKVLGLSKSTLYRKCASMNPETSTIFSALD